MIFGDPSRSEDIWDIWELHAVLVEFPLFLSHMTNETEWERNDDNMWRRVGFSFVASIPATWILEPGKAILKNQLDFWLEGFMSFGVSQDEEGGNRIRCFGTCCDHVPSVDLENRIERRNRCQASSCIRGIGESCHISDDGCDEASVCPFLEFRRYCGCRTMLACCSRSHCLGMAGGNLGTSHMAKQMSVGCESGFP